jgi:hypothetical protein
LVPTDEGNQEYFKTMIDRRDARCGVRVEDFPCAEPWARVTSALSNSVALLARELSWQGTARQYGLNWKSVATIVKTGGRLRFAPSRAATRPHHRHR